MNLNHKAYRVWPSLISSQAVDGHTQRAELTPTHWLPAIGRHQEKELGASI
jgi:hypothetical protein